MLLLSGWISGIGCHRFWDNLKLNVTFITTLDFPVGPGPHPLQETLIEPPVCLSGDLVVHPISQRKDRRIDWQITILHLHPRDLGFCLTFSGKAFTAVRHSEARDCQIASFIEIHPVSPHKTLSRGLALWVRLRPSPCRLNQVPSEDNRLKRRFSCRFYPEYDGEETKQNVG